MPKPYPPAPTLTIETYQHVLPAMQTAAVGTIDTLINRPKPRAPAETGETR